MTATSTPDILLVLIPQMANTLLHAAVHQRVEPISRAPSIRAAPRPAKVTVTVLSPITVRGGHLQTHIARDASVAAKLLVPSVKPTNSASTPAA